ncbi:MAG TPA: tripartite tricarboxylate transporter substrate binding protein [Burkholderiales bacterium]|nr:tripartite tricarboxylate transporter substrate binding protein [Burkholderiales bacterium]
MFKIKYLQYFLLLALAHGVPVWAQTWVPTKNVEIIVASVPGGSNDKTGREIEKALNELKIVPTSTSIVGKPGGGGGISMAYTNQHPGDGHYLMVATSSINSNHIIGASKLTYHDFTPIASLVNDYVVFAVKTDSPLKTGKELMAQLKSKPQAFPMGFANTFGGSRHIAAGLLIKAIGGNARDLKTVVFKGSSEAISGLLGGHLEMVIIGAGNAVAHVQSGRMRVLAVTSPQRLSGALSFVPTWRELGVDVVSGSWRGVMGPKELPAAQLAFWENAMRQVSQNAGWKTDIERNYWSEDFAIGAQFRKDLEKDYTDTKKILVDIGLAK